jgi:hypothetical protein
MANHIIFSAFQSDHSKASNDFNHSNVKTFLSGLDVKFLEVDGVYNSVAERSILVSGDQAELVERLCRLYNQDCFLRVDSNNNAELIFISPNGIGGARAPLGVWQNVCRSVAESHECYTRHGDNFYVCSPKNLPTPSLGSRL